MTASLTYIVNRVGIYLFISVNLLGFQREGDD